MTTTDAPAPSFCLTFWCARGSGDSGSGSGDCVQLCTDVELRFETGSIGKAYNGGGCQS